MRITILCENTVGVPGLIGEHGFSALVELDTEAILMDTGAGQGLLHNTRVLRKDLSVVEKILISHGHYDHTEGFPQALALTHGADVYAHPDIFAERIAIIGQGENQIQRFIGLPYRREYLEGLGAEFNLECGFTEVAPDVFLTGEVPRESAFEKGDPRLFIRRKDEYIPDDFPDDQFPGAGYSFRLRSRGHDKHYLVRAEEDGAGKGSRPARRHAPGIPFPGPAGGVDTGTKKDQS